MEQSGGKITRKTLCRERVQFPQPWQKGGIPNKRLSPTALKLKGEAPGALRHSCRREAKEHSCVWEGGAGKRGLTLHEDKGLAVIETCQAHSVPLCLAPRQCFPWQVHHRNNCSLDGSGNRLLPLVYGPQGQDITAKLQRLTPLTRGSPDAELGV